jgi:uncharacterized membrane protein
MARGGIELWLDGKHRFAVRQQDRIMFWAIVGGIGVIAGILGQAFAVSQWFFQK